MKNEVPSYLNNGLLVLVPSFSLSVSRTVTMVCGYQKEAKIFFRSYSGSSCIPVVGYQDSVPNFSLSKPGPLLKVWVPDPSSKT